MNFNLVAEIAVNGSEMASSSVMERSALEARHLQAEGAHQVEVHQAGGRCLQAGGHQHGKGAAFATQHKLVIIVAIGVFRSKKVI